MKYLGAIFLAGALTACNDQYADVLQGYAEGEYLRVASPAAGQLARLHVARGAEVMAGDPLFALVGNITVLKFAPFRPASVSP
jgi:HlyD family secretion protein